MKKETSASFFPLHQQGEENLKPQPFLANPGDFSKAELIRMIQELNTNMERVEIQYDEKLRMSDDRYNSLFYTNHTIMLLVDPESGKIMDANAAACDYYGWSYSAICTMLISQINIMSADQIKLEMQLAKDEKRNYFNFRHRLASGEIRDVEVYSGPINIFNSTLLYSNIHDITGRKRIEIALQESETKFRTIIQSQAEGIGIVDKYERFEFVNQAAENIFESKPNQLIGVSLFDFLVEKEIEKITNQTLSRTGGVANKYELQITTLKGNVRFIFVSATPRFDENGHYIGAYAVFQDITERKYAEIALKDKSTLLTNLIINLQEGILLEDSDRKIILTNQLFCDMFAIPAPPEALTGADCSESAEQSKNFFKDPEKFVENILEILANKKTVLNDELELTDGRYFERDYIPTFMGQIYTGHLWKYRDITAKKQSEELIRKQNERLNAIISAMPDLIFVIDQYGNNEEYYTNSPDELLAPASEMIGSNINTLFDKTTADIHMLRIKECLLVKKLITYEYHTTGASATRYYEARLIPLSSDKVLAFVRDITEKKQKDHEIKKLYLAVEQSPVSIVITDLRGNIEYVNPALLANTGYLYEELLGKNMRIFKSGSTRDEVYNDLWRTISGGDIWHGEWLVKKKNKALFWEQVSINPILAENGEIANYLAIKQDITHRKETEDEILNLNVNLEIRIAERTVELAETNEILQKEIAERQNASAAMEGALERLQKIADRVPGVVYQFRMRPDQTSCFPYASKGVEDIFRVKPEDIFNDASVVFSMIHPEDIEGVIESIQVSARDLSLWRHEFRVKFNDATIHWLLGNAMPQCEADGSVLWHGFISDITESKQVEEALQWNQSLLQLMSNSSPLGFLVVDNRTDDILYFNQRFCQIWGIEYLAERMKSEKMKNNDIIPHCLPVLSDVPAFAESCKPLQDESNRIVVSDEIQFSENRTIHRYSTQIRGENDKYYGRFYIFEDVTQSKLIEQEIKRARFEAEHANMAKSEFLSRMSHELRTPMNSILGFAQLLEMGDLNAGQQKGVGHILRSGKLLLELINEVLDISRIEAGQILLSMVPVQLNKIIPEMMDTVQLLAKARNVSVAFENNPGSDIVVSADIQRLRQVLLNLLNNAIKYNNYGGSITITAVPVSPNGEGHDDIRILIKDSGEGISKGDIPKLFKSFERIGAEKTQTEGTGLGLAVVKKLTEAMGGKVGVESIVGEGSTFWIELPQSSSQSGIKDIPLEVVNAEQGLAVRQSCVLYIEDNTPNIELVEQILSSQRSEIKFIANKNGRQAVPLAIEYKPNLILLDLNLPDIIGSEVIRNLQADEKTRLIPIVIVSADAMAVNLKKYFNQGVKDYLTKPLDINLFLRVIDQYILN